MLNIIKKIIVDRINHRERIISKDFSSNKKRILISYILPSAPGSPIFHTNKQEIPLIIEVFEELGYVVDVVNWDDIEYTPNPNINYDIVFGFGYPYERIGFMLNVPIRIYYATGAEAVAANSFIRERMNYLLKRRKLRIFDSRYAPTNKQVEQSTDIISISNDHIGKTYTDKYPEKPFYTQTPTALASNITEDEIIQIINNKDFSRARRKFLFLGGGGSLCKGMDLLLDVFAARLDIQLDICISSLEPEFIESYREILYKSPNIHFHQHVNINSDTFKQLVEECAYVVAPSATEGSNTSVLTCMNHGLIPIVTEGAGVTVNKLGFKLDSYEIEYIGERLEALTNKDGQELKRLALENLHHSRYKFSEVHFKESFLQNIKQIINHHE